MNNRENSLLLCVWVQYHSPNCLHNLVRLVPILLQIGQTDTKTSIGQFQKHTQTVQSSPIEMKNIHKQLFINYHGHSETVVNKRHFLKYNTLEKVWMIVCENVCVYVCVCERVCVCVL